MNELRISEADFQRRVTDTAELHGWRWCHIRRATVRKGRIATPTSVPGWPDLVLWNPMRGGVLFVELKGTTGYLSPEQRALLSSLRNAGAEAYAWWPKDWPEAERILSFGAARGSEGDGPHQQGKAEGN